MKKVFLLTVLGILLLVPQAGFEWSAMKDVAAGDQPLHDPIQPPFK